MRSLEEESVHLQSEPMCAAPGLERATLPQPLKSRPEGLHTAPALERLQLTPSKEREMFEPLTLSRHA